MLETRKTKIIATLGPASDSEETLEKMINAGMDVARLNFSHGTHEGMKVLADTVKRVRARMGRYTALLLDTKGPKFVSAILTDRLHLSAVRNIGFCSMIRLETLSQRRLRIRIYGEMSRSTVIF